MAERKTKYTNADLKPQGGPATEYGPWTRTPESAAALQAIIGDDVGIDQILADAKQALATPTVGTDWFNSLLESQRASGVARATPMPTGKDAIRSLLMVPGLLPGPVGVTAQLGSAALAASEGNFGEAGMNTALAALPYGMGKLGKAVDAEQDVVRFVKHAYPPGRGSAAAGEASGIIPRGPKPRPTPYTPGQRPQGLPPVGLPGRVAPRQLPAGQRQLPPARGSMDALLQETRDVPFEVVNEAPVTQVPGTMSEIDELIRGIPSTPKRRPAGDFVHPADRTGAMFGFDDLPEISEAELAAMQRRWGGRK